MPTSKLTLTKSQWRCNMTEKHKEIVFEDEVCDHLKAHGWLHDAPDVDRKHYDRELAIYVPDAIAWLKDTQPETWAKIKGEHNGSSEKLLIERIAKVMDTGGSLSVLRHGFKDVSARFDMCQFKPSHGLNPEILDRYNKVRLRVVRQLHYSVNNENSIDLVLFINGIPVATLELKTDFTQNVQDAIRQYKYDRQPKDPVTRREEPLLAFKRRALVHFAVSSDEVYMSTRLEGKDTFFLPFNLGHDGGKGNPPNPNGYRTSYLWERILERDTFMNIMGRFIHLAQEQKTDKQGKKFTKETLIFPRYHQWEAVTKLIGTARQEKAGHKYLIQHSAGSGKTNSIAWLAHQLAGLHDEKDTKVFDSVIVITDRTILDTQLQDAIYQFEHKQGVVQRVTDDAVKSKQLADALINRTPVIIVTIQTFPFVLETVKQNASLKDRNFAVIADEAHSSQAGAAARKLKLVLASEQDEEGEELGVEEILTAEMAARGQPKNISYFAFTATPKAKTLELFGRRRPDGGEPEAFHLYTMQQAIEENFILDVLKNFTPYKLAFKLAHDGKDYDDETVEKSEAVKSLMRWVRLHPYNISQKVQIIVEHYRQNVQRLLNGEAKAMVVTASRKEAVRYKLTMDKYIREMGYKDLATLVAFSGEVVDPESGATGFTEGNMNSNLRGMEIREGLDSDDFQVLIVANKYQTGFDQPKLVAMYVDKKLAGVAAVQTLSRLNRTYKGKEQTFVLDFVNSPEDIRLAFEPYYKKAELLCTSDPNLIHDLQNKLDELHIYTAQEVNLFAEAFLKGQQKDLQARISPAVDRFRSLYRQAEEEKNKKDRETLDLFRKDMVSFIRAYDFLSQIVNYGDTDLEKRFIFYRHLIPWLQDDKRKDAIDLSTVSLMGYALKKKDEASIKLGDDSDESKLKPLTALGSREARDPTMIALSAIVKQMNDLFEGELTKADFMGFTTYLSGKIMESGVLEQQAAANTREQFASSPDFKDAMINAALEGSENHQDMVRQLLEKKEIQSRLIDMLADLVYAGFAAKRGNENSSV